MNRILVVNDSKFESIVLNDMLSQMGYNVIVTDEYNTMYQMQRFIPNVVLANYIMKDTSGDKLIGQIKSKYPMTACILSSNNKLDIHELNYQNIDAIIRTPINKHNLMAVLKEIEERHENPEAYDIKKDENISDIRSMVDKWKHKAEGALEESSKDNSVPSQNSNIEKPNKSLEEIWNSQGNKDKKFVFCPYCGHEIKEEQNSYAFCPYCGHKL